MSEMVERVARALYLASNGANGPTPDAVVTCGPRKEIGLPLWKLFEDRARAAIAAMREPTEAMKEAGGAVETSAGDYNVEISYAAEKAWRAMIDAALR